MGVIILLFGCRYQPPALSSLLMCWHLRVAVGLVAGPLPLLLLEVEVKVLLQVVRVELPLR